jgi:hypothetical protein
MKKERLYSKSGEPVYYFSENNNVALIFNSPVKKALEPTPNMEDMPAEGGIAYWGSDNNKPKTYKDYFKKSTVLSQAIGIKAKMAIGNGLIVGKLVDFDANGRKVIDVNGVDKKILNFYTNAQFTRSLYEAYKNMYFSGNGFIELRKTLDGKGIGGINSQHFTYVRLGEVKSGRIDKAYISGEFPQILKDKMRDLPYIPDYDAADFINNSSKNNFIYHIYNYTPGEMVYGWPLWEQAIHSEWLDISIATARFLKAVMKNQLAIKYHIQSPQGFWETNFPESKYDTKEEWVKAMDEFMDNMIANLTGEDNGKKAFHTKYTEGYKDAIGEWKIDVIDDKWKSTDYLPQSQAANSEILFNMEMNPAIIGAGAPGGPYSNNAGGSNIREAFLANAILAQPDRLGVIEMCETIRDVNGWDEDLVFETQNNVLTTLDTGSGTKIVNQ